jgi:type IX secretion system PorP/SprF family membrane protein
LKKLLPIYILLLLACVNKVRAQIDPHFSQYYAYPLWLNPALTGVIDGDARITANVKDQWASVPNAYKTAAFSGDFRTSEKVALGFNVLDQSAGTAGYNYLSAYGSFAYQIALSANKYQNLKFGLQAGMINRSFNASKLQLDNQYNSATGGYDPTIPNSETFSGANTTVFDASAGIFYYNGNPQSNVNLFLGASIAHLAPIKDTTSTDGLSGRVPYRYTAHGGLRIRASEFLDITPHAIYILQQKNEIKAAGVNLEFKFQPDYSFIIGGMYRVNDAAVGNVGFHLGSLMIGVSYDYTTSSFQTAANPQGTYELSLSYVFKHHLSSRGQICPRL